MLHISVGKKVFRRQQGDIRLSVFDALNENTGINRNIANAYFEDVRSTVLQRYYMLTFTYNLRKFGSGKALPASRPDREDRGRGNFNRGNSKPYKPK